MFTVTLSKVDTLRTSTIGVLLREMSPYRESNKGGKEGQGPTLGVRLLKGVR